MAMGNRFPASVDGRVHVVLASFVTTTNSKVATSTERVVDYIEGGDVALAMVSEYFMPT